MKEQDPIGCPRHWMSAATRVRGDAKGIWFRQDCMHPNCDWFQVRYAAAGLTAPAEPPTPRSP